MESSKGKKASVSPKSSKVSDESETEQPAELPNPTDVQPGYEGFFFFFSYSSLCITNYFSKHD